MTETYFCITSYICFTVFVHLKNCLKKFIGSVSPKIELSKTDLSTSRNSSLLFGGSDSQCKPTTWSMASESTIMLAMLSISFQIKVRNNTVRHCLFTVLSSFLQTGRRAGFFSRILWICWNVFPAKNFVAGHCVLVYVVLSRGSKVEHFFCSCNFLRLFILLLSTPSIAFFFEMITT